MAIKIGIDVGGTFTDFVLMDRLSGRTVHHKEPSTPSDPALAVETGVAGLLDRAGVAPAEVELVVHGTTIALNAILQRRGADVAVVVSRGNRDLLEIARLRMASSYDFFAQPEPPLTPRDRVVEIDARLDADGTAWLRPTPAELDRVAAALAALAPDAVAVVLLHAYRDPAFEAAVARGLGDRLPGLPIAASTEIWSEMREYERGMAAVMNAYVAPTLRRYYDRLEAAFATLGIRAPLSITANNGGTIDLATARARPVDGILSGPASGVVAAIDAARVAGRGDLVTFDMGGTSADISIVRGDRPEITTRTMIGEAPLILPTVAVGAIGAGGGSIVRVDAEGVLKVGPASAGADPGPACYGRGGRDATITDCYLACGILDPGGFLGGRLALSPALARAALEPVAARLGLSGPDAVERAAEAALRVASSMMATEIRKMLARRGVDPRGFTLLPYGGAGPTHAALLAAEAGLGAILVAGAPGTFCALGAVVADLRRDFVRSVRLLLDGADSPAAAELAAALAGLRVAAEAWTASIGERVEGWRFDLSADLRYPGQAYDLTVVLAGVQPGQALAAELVERFHAEHGALYGFAEPGSVVELGRIVLAAIGARPPAAAPAAPAGRPAAPRQRAAWLDGAHRTVAAVARDGLAVGQRLAGPAIVEQPDTTILVPPGWALSVLAGGGLLIEREMGQ